MSDKKTFDLWMQGYAIQGNISGARFLGTYEEPLFPYIRKETSSLVE